MGESIQDWKNSFDLLEDIMIIINKDYTIEKINKKGLELLGKKEKDVVGCKCYKILHGIDTPQDFCPYKQTKKTNQAVTTERYEKIFDKYFSIKCSPIFNDKGEIVKFVDLMRDGTDQKKVENELILNKRQYSELFNRSRDGLVMVDSKGRIIDANKAYCEMLGYSLFELKQLKDFYEITPTKWRELEEKKIWNEKLLKNGYSGRYEKEYIKKDGTVFPVELESYLVRNKNGDIDFLWGVVRDITKEKKSEKKLQKILEENKFQADLLKNAPIIAAFHDCNHNIQWANKAYEKATGKTLKEIKGKKCYSVWGLSKPCNNCPVLKSIETGKTEESEISPENQDHWPEELGYWISKAAPIRDSDNKIIGALETAFDITEKKKYERELNNKNNVIKKIFDTTPNCVFIKDKDGRYLLANKVIADLFQTTPEKMIGKKDTDFADDSILKHSEAVFFKEIDNKIIKNRKTQIIPCESFTNKDGETHYFFTTKSSIKYNNDLNCVLGISVDITDLKKYEEKLAEGKNFLKQITETIPVSITKVDRNGDFVYANRKTEDILGISKNDIKKRSFDDVNWKITDYDGNPYPTDRLPFELVKKGKPVYDIRHAIELPDGKRKFLSVNSAPLFNDGEFDGAVSSIEDITKIIKSKQSLKKNKFKYSTVFENTGTATCIFNDDHVIMQCNKFFEEISGYSKKEIEGKMKWDDFLPEYELKRKKKYHKQRSKGTGNPPLEYEFDFLNKKGELKTVHANISLIPHTKKRVFSLLDITERKKAEKKIKKSLKEKETLLKEVHHRVKNNLQIISTMLKLQSDLIDDEDSLNRFKESQSRIQSIALVHERLYKSENIAEINLDKYVDSLIVDLIYLYKDKTNTIRWDCNCDNISLSLNTTISCALIINELVSNSLKYAFKEKKQGKICVDLKSENTHHYTLIIRDNGKGLPKNFDIKKPSSLGLQLVTNLVKQINGKIRYYNDKGAVFEIMFRDKTIKN